MKLRIGIIFGGQSREREISFAGGRTVYDNLNKSLFEAVPIFVDSFGNFILLDWHFIYKGSIRDFYPPISFLSELPSNYQVYSESLGDLTHGQQLELNKKIGKNINPAELSGIIDFAFLCLHGSFGEDGRMQGLLEYLNIPYSGSGILSSAIGINKAIQKKLMKDAGFAGPSFVTFNRNEWNAENEKEIFQKINKEVGFPCVIKPAHQGSSIGVSVVEKDDASILKQKIEKAFFIQKINKKDWNGLKQEDKEAIVRIFTDIREGIGMPVYISTNSITEKEKSEKIFHPAILLKTIDERFKNGSEELILESADGESEVVVEKFIEGKEFSCIVIRNENGNPIALPPTEIRKGKELFDYRSKYLPGLSRKITPVELPYKDIQHIRQECEKLFLHFNFNVYARIDGFITKDGKIFLNDPNTTSGMLPSSFFFHQLLR
jgi:D-alanine-D-alanine ligase